MIRGKDRFNLLFLAFLFIFFWSAVIIGGKHYGYRDIFTYNFPLQVFARETLIKGEITFWNPYFYAGIPFLADIISVLFYPLSILLHIFSYSEAIRLFILLHHLLIIFIFYIFCRSLCLKAFSSLIGAIIIGFTGITVSLMTVFTFLGGVFLFLVGVLLLEEIYKRKRFNLDWAILVGFCVTFMFLSAAPEVLIFFILFGFTFICSIKKKEDRIKISLFLGVAFILMGLFSAFQVLPFVEFVNLSTRGDFLTYANATNWSFELKEIFRFFISNSMQHMEFYSKLIGQVYIKNLYMGILPILMGGGSYFFLKKGTLWKRLIFLSFILSPGKNFPSYYLCYRYLPFFGKIRYPVKFLILSLVGFSILACKCFEKLTRLHFQKKLQTSPPKNTFLTKQILLALVIIVIIFDLFISNMNYDPLLKDKRLFFEKPLILSYLKRDKNFWRILISPQTNTWLNLIAVPYLSYADRLQFTKNYLRFNLSMLEKVYNTEGWLSLTIRDYNKFMDTIKNQPAPSLSRNLIDFLGIKYIVSRNYLNEKGFSLKKEDKFVKIYENKNSLPHTFLVPTAKILIKDRILNYLLSNEFDPRKEVVIEKPISGFRIPRRIRLRRTLRGGQDSGDRRQKAGDRYTMQDARCQILKYEPNEVKIKCYLERRGWLVLSDTYYPGWKVYINGIKHKIYKANYCFRAVYLNKGYNFVIFKYIPMSFCIGLWVSLISLICMIYRFNYTIIKKGKRWFL